MTTTATAVSKIRPQWFILGTVVLAAAIGGVLRIVSVQGTAPTSSEVDQPDQEAAIATAEETETPTSLFQTPMVALSAELRKAAMPSELVNSTSGEDRLSSVTAGRADPFAPITQTIGAKSSPAEPTTAATTAVGTTVSALPTAPVSSIPDLPPVPAVAYAPPVLPPIPMASSPVSIPSLPSALPNSFPQSNPVPQNPVQAIELTGVVQVGNRVGVIVREGNGQSSRHLFEGDLLAGGQIRVKSIDLSAQEPLVILEYQGQEYTRMVG